MKKLLIFGVGYTGSYIASSFKRRGYKVVGTVRSMKETCRTMVDELYEFNDSTIPSPTELFANVTHIVVCIPPTDDGDVVLNCYQSSLLQYKSSIQWIGYLSTIAVYGDTGSTMVTETASCHTNLARGQRRITAEQQYLSLEMENVYIFRLPGIYGPSRGPLAKVKKGIAKRIDIPGKVFHRIYVEDIVNILFASMYHSVTHRIYNVGDDLPIAGHEVVLHAANLLEVSPPPLKTWEEVEPTMSEMAKSFYQESKRISTDRMRQELDVSLLYPTYKEGLQAQLQYKELEGAEQRNTAVIVVNIGSLKPEPYIDLRRICDQLACLSDAMRNVAVIAEASARFSTRIDPALLYDEPADDIISAVHKLYQSRYYGHLVVLPLFFGPSDTILSYIPEQLELALSKCSSIFNAQKPMIHIAPHLVCQNDTRIASCLASKIHQISSDNYRVILVDHGTPSKAVHEVREVIGNQLKHILPEVDVLTASMERREGDEYAFNEPLLENAFVTPGYDTGNIVVALLFFSNGRHAGKRGDIEGIIETVRQQHPQVNIEVTTPLRHHALLSHILADRVVAALQ